MPRTAIITKPEINYGLPTIKGDGVRVETVVKMMESGCAVDEIAEALGLFEYQVDDALEWWSRNGGKVPVEGTELKACPFCGGRDLTVDAYCIECKDCGGAGPSPSPGTDNAEPKATQEAIKTWNQRKRPCQKK